jgi:hypothetical protein
MHLNNYLYPDSFFIVSLLCKAVELYAHVLFFVKWTEWKSSGNRVILASRKFVTKQKKLRIFYKYANENDAKILWKLNITIDIYLAYGTHSFTHVCILGVAVFRTRLKQGEEV